MKVNQYLIHDLQGNPLDEKTIFNINLIKDNEVLNTIIKINEDLILNNITLISFKNYIDFYFFVILTLTTKCKLNNKCIFVRIECRSNNL